MPGKTRCFHKNTTLNKRVVGLGCVRVVLVHCLLAGPWTIFLGPWKVFHEGGCHAPLGAIGGLWRTLEPRISPGVNMAVTLPPPPALITFRGP